MNYKLILDQFNFDHGLNLIQNGTSSASQRKRLIVAERSNRAIGEKFYNELELSPSEKSNLDQTLLDKSIFDHRGNQKVTKTGKALNWDYRNQIQSSVTQQSDGQISKAYSVYAKTGLRNRQITEKINSENHTIEITEALYLGHLEYRTTWQGSSLSYDGESVIEKSTGQPVDPYEKYSALRVCQAHKQVAQKRTYYYQGGIKVFAQSTSYTLDNNIDSCELTLGGYGWLESYESYKPYGETAISYGRLAAQPYKYSGQEKDVSGLYYFGYRSLDPGTFRWVSPDPAGIQGSGLNWYAMVKGNPVSIRDIRGLGFLKILGVTFIVIPLNIFGIDYMSKDDSEIDLYQEEAWFRQDFEKSKQLLQEFNNLGRNGYDVRKNIFRTMRSENSDRMVDSTIANLWNPNKHLAAQPYITELDKIPVGSLKTMRLDSAEEAFEFIEKKILSNSFELSLSFIFEVHKILVDNPADTMRLWSGLPDKSKKYYSKKDIDHRFFSFRNTTQDWSKHPTIKDRWVGLPPEQVIIGLNKVIDHYYNHNLSSYTDRDPAIFHKFTLTIAADIVGIHPFIYGNHRTGQMILYAIHRNYSTLGYLNDFFYPRDLPMYSWDEASDYPTHTIRNKLVASARQAYSTYVQTAELKLRTIEMKQDI